MKREPRPADGPTAVAVGIVDLVVVAMLATAYVLSGLTIGAPDARELHDTEVYRHTVVVVTAVFAGAGGAVAALFRFHRTSVTHLVVTGLALLAFVAL
ncbi:hypothetical protein [Streptomyces sp. NPDC093225]|uniref:hypothetical protein n=1 Tax=Streptomyces sp. NPDC093225 TaxID=3366034 RepID=UPI003818153B